MKVLIHYNPGKTLDAFEGTRLRKTLKGACEMSDISWVNSPYTEVDIAHFLSPRDLNLLKMKKSLGVPCVVSAFYAEDDPRASFLKQRDSFKISSSGIAMLSEADLILVPSEPLKKNVIAAGIKTRVEVLEPAVRMNRFRDGGPENEIFKRYFHIKEKEAYVVSTGSYHDKKTYNSLKKCAKACPNISFYYFAAGCRSASLGGFPLKKIGCPPNMHFQAIVQDDIYRSGLINALAYISNDSFRPDAITPLEAFAAKTQVVCMASSSSNPMLQHGVNCYCFPTPESLGDYLTRLNSGEAESTITSAYQVAEAHNLINHGRLLKSFYEELLEKKQ